MLLSQVSTLYTQCSASSTSHDVDNILLRLLVYVPLILLRDPQLGFQIGAVGLQTWRDSNWNEKNTGRVWISDVTARLGFNTPGLGLALTAQGFKNMKPKPWADL